MPATQAFVLMNLDLIAVPLQVGGAAVTIYCGARRASQLLGDLATPLPALDVESHPLASASSDRERTYPQSTRSFMSSQSAAPPESFSISGHFSAGTIPRLIHS